MGTCPEVCSRWVKRVKPPEAYDHEELPWSPSTPFLIYLRAREMTVGFVTVKAGSGMPPAVLHLRRNNPAIDRSCSKHPSVGKCLGWLNATRLFCYANVYIPGVTHASKCDTSLSRVEFVHSVSRPQIPRLPVNPSHSRRCDWEENVSYCWDKGQRCRKYLNLVDSLITINSIIYQLYQ